MRIQMRLSQEARVILEEKKLHQLKLGITKTSGEVIDDIFKKFNTRLSKIDWLIVKNNPKYDGILANYTMVNPTTLNLNESTITIIDEFRDFFNVELKMKRTVYRSFIIRIVLKAYKLEQENYNIYK